MKAWLQRLTRSLDALEDGELARRAAHGEAEAFRVLYERTNAPVAHTILRIVGNPASLDDIVQETYIKAFQALDSFDTSRPFAPWIATIARNTALTHLRRRRDMIALDQVRHLRSADQWSTLTARERLSAFRAALDLLPDPAREALLLHDIEGLTLREVADTLDVPLNTVASRVRRARSRISELMDTRPRKASHTAEGS